MRIERKRGLQWHTLTTADDRNPASTSVHISSICALYYQDSFSVGIADLYKVTQGFYHEQYQGALGRSRWGCNSWGLRVCIA